LRRGARLISPATANEKNHDAEGEPPKAMRSEPKKNSAYESPLMTRTNRIKKGNLSERSEFVSLPDLCVASTGTSRSEAANRGRLSLLTFFGEAKKVSGCRAAPGNHGSPKKEQLQLRQKFSLKKTQTSPSVGTTKSKTHPPPIALTTSTLSASTNTRPAHNCNGTTCRLTATATPFPVNSSAAISCPRSDPSATTCGFPFNSICIAFTATIRSWNKSRRPSSRTPPTSLPCPS
jgi:hypothetical protein